MTEERVSPLRQRMIEDMRIRGMGDKAQKYHIRAIKDFAAFLGRSPDIATPDDLRAYQLHMADTGVSVGDAQPDRQELTIKGSVVSRSITDFYVDTVSDGGDFIEMSERPANPRASSLKAQLDDLLLCIAGKPNRLATPGEALRVQKLVETMLVGRS